MTSDDEKQQKDRVLRAMTDDGAFRVMTIRSTDTVREAAAAQEVEGIPAVQLGELITGAVLVRETMAPGYRVQVLLRDQAESTIVGDAFPEGRTRGLVRVTDDILGVPLSEGGILQVMRSLPGRAPHQGVVEVDLDGGIDQALMSYFRQSEQIETMVAVSCVEDDGQIVAAGGYVVQLLPELTAPPLEAMNARLRAFGDLGPQLVPHDADPQWLLDALLKDTDYTGLAESPVCFACGCGNEKAIGAVAALGEAEVRELLAKNETVKVSCDYCRTPYEVGPDDFRRILDSNE